MLQLSLLLLKVLLRIGVANFYARIKDRMSRSWELIFTYTYYEGNVCAEWIANWSLSRLLGVHKIDDPTMDLVGLLIGVLSGASIPV